MRHFSVALILLLYMLSAAAQSPTDGAIADIDRLFTSNVEIVDYGVWPSADSVRYDTDARLLLVGDQRYPYPDVINLIYSAQYTAAEKLILNVRESAPETGVNGVGFREWVWYFDIQTETFTRFTNRCDDRTRLNSFDIESPWIYVRDDDTGQVHLCELASGKISKPLPAHLSWEVQSPISTPTVPVSASPDGQWFVLIGVNSDQIHVFSYNILSENLKELGLVACNFCVEGHAVSWYGSLVTIWIWNNNTHQIYSAEVDQADSLELAVTRPRYLPEFYENPPRYDYVNFTLPENIWDTQCERVIYDILSGATQIVEMGSACRPEQGSLDGIGYYRDVTRGADGIAALMRFDTETGESEILYEGEIELLEWISPDERFAVLVTGSNGRIDILPFLASDSAWRFPDSPKLTFVDLVTDTILFEDWTGWRWCDAPFGGPDWSWSGLVSENSVTSCGNIGPTGAIVPRADGTLLVIGALEPQESQGIASSTGFADIVRVKDGMIERTRIAEGWFLPFSPDHILSVKWEDTRRTLNYILIPVDGGVPMEITNDIPVDDYQSLMLTHVDPSRNQLRFYLSPEPAAERDWYSAQVTVQVNMH